MKAKSFYKNNKHNNMDSKEKENINEEELKAQDAQDETCEETTEKEEGLWSAFCFFVFFQQEDFVLYR